MCHGHRLSRKIWCRAAQVAANAGLRIRAWVGVRVCLGEVVFDRNSAMDNNFDLIDRPFSMNGVDMNGDLSDRSFFFFAALYRSETVC